MCFASNPLHYALVADLSRRIKRAVTLGTRKAKTVEKATATLPPRNNGNVFESPCKDVYISHDLYHLPDRL